MRVVIVSTPFTRVHLRQSKLLLSEYVIDEPYRLISIVNEIIIAEKQGVVGAHNLEELIPKSSG